ncbi:MAG: TolC family protein [Gemmatimonadetes bacterium]|nr:TolC family protein [Gemmatimonadota bacterium]
MFAASRRAELSRDVLALNERLSDVARRQLREGEISKLDFNLAVIELGRSRARTVGAARDRDDADLELRRLLGLDRRAVIQPIVDSAHRHLALDSTGAVVPGAGALAAGGRSVDALTASAITRRPDLLARDAAVARAAAEVSLAGREAFPNLIARLTTEGAVTGGSTVPRVGIGLAVPILNRNGGAIDARGAAHRQLQRDRASTVQRIRAEVEAAVRAYVAATTEVELLESTVLLPARENRQLLEAAYREGKVGLPVLLLIRNQVIDAEQAYWSAWLAEREALAALAAATGENASTPSGARP